MRTRRLLQRLAIVVVALALLGIGAFTYVFHWPLEGKVARLEDLVPAEVDFVYKASWQDVRRTGWVDRNVLEHPVHPALDAKAAIEGALAELRRNVDEINASIPVEMLRLDLERDFLSDAVVVAGRFCGGGNPKVEPPRWREILGLVRMSRRARADISALRHGFIRSRSGPKVTIEDRGGYLQLEVHTIRPTSAKERGGCEGGYVRPPENLWFLARVKDALAITNSEDLAEKVVALGKGEGDRAADRPEFELKATDGGISAVVDLVPLRSYLNRALSGPEVGEVATLLGRFTTIDALDRMNATLEPHGLDGVQAFADVQHIPSDLHRDVKATYDLPPRPFADSVAHLVPLKDTVAVAQIETPPLNLLRALYDVLSPGDRKLWEQNVRDITVKRAAAGEKGYASVLDFMAELADKLQTTTGVAVARLSTVFDQVEYADWFSPADPKPQAAFAIVVRVRADMGATPEERRKNVDDFLSDRVRLLGLGTPVAAERNGIPYSRLQFELKIRDFEHVRPAYVVFEDRLVIASHEDYLFAILDTARGGPGAPPSVASSEAFRSTAKALPQDVTVGVWVNVDEYRKLRWDYRNEWVHREHADDAHAKRFRIKLAQVHGASPEARATIDDQVDREVERYRTEEYPRFIEEYRRSLQDLSRLRAGGLALAAGASSGEDLRGGFVALFHPPEGKSP